MSGVGVRQGALSKAGARSHGAGSNLANDPPPSLPLEPLVRETVDQFRERMWAKRDRGLQVQAAPGRQRHRQLVDDRFSEPDLDPTRVGDAEPHDDVEPAIPPVPVAVTAERRPVPPPPARVTPSAAPPAAVLKQAKAKPTLRTVRRPAPARTPAVISDTVRLVEDYLAGKSAPELAVRTGLTPKTVRARLRAAGVRLRDDRVGRSGGANRKTADDDDPQVAAAVVAAYAGGSSVAEVAASVAGVGSAKHATSILRRADVTLRPPASARRTRTPEVWARVLSLKARGPSDREVGERIGVGQPTVSRWLREHRAALAEVRPEAGCLDEQDSEDQR